MRRLLKFAAFGLANPKLFRSPKTKNPHTIPPNHQKQSTQGTHSTQQAIETVKNNQDDYQYLSTKQADQSLQEEVQQRSNLFQKHQKVNPIQKAAKKQKIQIHFDNLPTKQSQKDSTEVLKLLLLQRKEIFEQSNLLPGYLHRISSHLTAQSYHANQKELIDINRKLNDFSSELGSNPVEYLAILNYRYICRMLQPRFSEVDNYKFIHKASVVCQMLIYKQQLELSQVIYVMQALLRMSALTITLIMNFTKYIKKVLEEEKQVSKATLEHILTILNMGIIKRNQVTIQNILYDQVFNFLLKNIGSLLTEKPIWMKVEVLNLLLVIDIKRFYRVDRKNKQLQTQNLFKEVLSNLNSKWFEEMLQKGANQQPKQDSTKMNWKSVLSIVQSINFATEQRLQELQYVELFDQFMKTNLDIVLSISDKLDNQQMANKLSKLSEEEKRAVVRIIFNTKSLQLWAQSPSNTQKITKIMLAINLSSQQSFVPITNLIYRAKNHSDNLFLTTITSISQKVYIHYKKSMNLFALLIALKQNGESPLINQAVQQLSLTSHDKCFKTKLSIYLIQQKYLRKNMNNNEDSQKMMANDIQEQQRRGKSLIMSYYEVIQNLRNLAVMESSFGQVWKKINANNVVWQKMKKTNTMRQQYMQLLEILVLQKLTSGELSSDLNSVLQYLIKEASLKNVFINRCYPPTYSYTDIYHKKTNAFTDITSFKSKFKALMTYYNDDKYSFYLWDLLIKHLVRLPQKLRRESYPLVQTVFLNAFQKDNLRKVVLLTVFTNHICSRTIIADRKVLANTIDYCIGELVKAEEIIEFHYHCYLQIVVNALSSNVLSLATFNLIMKHTYQKSPNIKETTTLVLLYGATISKQQGMEAQKKLCKIDSQISYLQMLANRRYIEQQLLSTPSFEGQERQVLRQRLTIFLSARLIAIYLRFGIKEIILIQKLVLKYVKECVDLGQWQLIFYSYNPEYFPQQSQKHQQFMHNLRSLLHQKLLFFKEKQLVSSEQFEELSIKLK